MTHTPPQITFEVDADLAPGMIAILEAQSWRAERRAREARHYAPEHDERCERGGPRRYEICRCWWRDEERRAAIPEREVQWSWMDGPTP